MNELLGSFGRALLGMLHPRMLWLTVLPFLLTALGWGAVLWFGWEGWVGAAHGWLSHWGWTASINSLLMGIGFGHVQMVLAPLVVVAIAVPLIVLTVLLMIAAISMPAVIRHLGARQFADLEPLRGGTLLGSLLHSIAATCICVLLLVVTVPLWLVPPLFAVIPPLLWGWLTYRVMTYDALAWHASLDERRMIFRTHRVPLLAIGVMCGMLGAVPTLLWASSVLMIVLFPFVAIVSIWLYVCIFVFSALWFAHYCLRVLRRLRARHHGTDRQPTQARPPGSA
ncbi:EI24 domain-containing protein [Mycetohabitans endofungorum]|uniref:EI24 domain-containing protein n=1 Tax=Mycetohabitans endofungorum TaxID=417203 RepID=UPI002B05EAE7|nr:EI24 domain-containing protein [Mycetohabitans endofungorum]